MQKFVSYVTSLLRAIKMILYICKLSTAYMSAGICLEVRDTQDGCQLGLRYNTAHLGVVICSLSILGTNMNPLATKLRPQMRVSSDIDTGRASIFLPYCSK